jgi:hypothetical protein
MVILLDGSPAGPGVPPVTTSTNKPTPDRRQT